MIYLYGPLLSSMMFFLGALYFNFGSKEVFEIERYGYKIIFTNNLIGKSLLFACSLNFIPAYMMMDFSQFFPENLRMQVFYDEAGVAETIGQFPATFLSELDIDESLNDTSSYFAELDAARLRVTGNSQGFFSSGLEISSSGVTSFIVEKLSGIHRYRVVSAEGRLTHSVVRPDGTEERFLTLFQKTPSANDFILPTIRDILIQRSIVVFPRFSQVIAKYGAPSGIEINHTLFGMTEVTLWPIPSFGRTLYLAKAKDGRLIPVAYAVYY